MLPAPLMPLGCAVPILFNVSDTDPDVHCTMPIPAPTGAVPPILDPEPLSYGLGYGEEWEGSLDPLAYQLQEPVDWRMDLGEASGLDTSPDTGMRSPPTVATEEGVSFSMMIRRAAEVFTKVMVTAHLRRSGFSVFPYLDEWLLKAGSPQAVVSDLQTTVDHLHLLGFNINMQKSHLNPTQTLPFI
ncbi:hypothetical protein NDU88_008753 [Pleurodeles waltl]|uniref:Reverse transcriptase domain-containing protein n=1 Tax=Pleurodeles waltl TaxID=8319 RepID=A0AAV7QVG4_PLEWA|nr:hypothetical protein NDU88_008753 [Pleurodeles waltl]